MLFAAVVTAGACSGAVVVVTGGVLLGTVVVFLHFLRPDFVAHIGPPGIPHEGEGGVVL